VTRAPARRDGAPAVDVAVREGVAWVTLCRPATRNRLDAALAGALVAACEAVEGDDAARVAVLAARGPAFSAGLPAGRAWPDAAWPDAVGAVARLGKPVVAAVQGDALGWGLALALACDLRVVASTATLALPDVGHGRLPGGGALARLVRMVGVARTLDLALLGTSLTAARAAAWGLASEVVAPRELARATGRVAAGLAARAPLALRLAKEAVVRALDLPLDDGIGLEQDLYVLLQTTGDRDEGLRGFLARRAPRFEGR